MNTHRLIKIRQLSIEFEHLDEKERYIFELLNKSIVDYSKFNNSITINDKNFNTFYIDIFNDSFKVFYDVVSVIMWQYNLKYDGAVDLIDKTLRKEMGLIKTA